jgi:hypothetical protein
LIKIHVSYDVMSHVFVMSCFFISCRVLSFCIILCHFVSFRVFSCLLMSCPFRDSQLNINLWICFEMHSNLILCSNEKYFNKTSHKLLQSITKWLVQIIVKHLNRFWDHYYDFNTFSLIINAFDSLTTTFFFRFVSILLLL